MFYKYKVETYSFVEVAFLNCGYEQESLVKHCHTRFLKKGLGFYQISMFLIHNAFLQVLILKQDFSGGIKPCMYLDHHS